MGNEKKPKPKAKGAPNKHLHARTTFLYQAATFLTLQTGAHASEIAKVPGNHLQTHSGLALQLGSDLHTVSRKGQVRLSSQIKRSVCKSCNTILIPGRTSSQRLENESKGGRKPWADVLVLNCTLCGSKKRFPVGAKRQKKKAERQPIQDQLEDVDNAYNPGPIQSVTVSNMKDHADVDSSVT